MAAHHQVPSDGRVHQLPRSLIGMTENGLTHRVRHFVASCAHHSTPGPHIRACNVNQNPSRRPAGLAFRAKNRCIYLRSRGYSRRIGRIASRRRTASAASISLFAAPRRASMGGPETWHEHRGRQLRDGHGNDVCNSTHTSPAARRLLPPLDCSSASTMTTPRASVLTSSAFMYGHSPSPPSYRSSTTSLPPLLAEAQTTPMSKFALMNNMSRSTPRATHSSEFASSTNSTYGSWHAWSPLSHALPAL